MSLEDHLARQLESLKADSRQRSLILRRGLDFSSNDYLGFSHDRELKKKIQTAAGPHFWNESLGSTGSRLLRGQVPLFEACEQALADFCGTEAALLFPTGYQANLGLLSAILTPADWVYSDELNHASLIDGMRLSGAKRRIYPHRNIQHLRALLEEDDLLVRATSAHRVVVTESIFSMDGTLAPLEELALLAKEFSASLIVDEAHATGLWGNFANQQGGGWVQKLNLTSQVLATVHPAGKAMGLSGAWVCGSQKLKNYLINFSRPFIFSTAPLPTLAGMLLCSLEHWKEVGIERAQSVLNQAQALQQSLSAITGATPESQSTEKDLESAPILSASILPAPIIPILLGSNERAITIAMLLQAQGFDVRAIRPPTVPVGKARLRITVNWTQTAAEQKDLVVALTEALKAKE